MHHWTWTSERVVPSTNGRSQTSGGRLLADGGHEEDETENTNESDDGTDAEEDVSGGGNGNVEVAEAGEAEPADPKWEPPDIENVEDIPEVTGPKTRPADFDRSNAAASSESGETAGGQTAADTDSLNGGSETRDSTAGMPNTARSPGESRLKNEGTDGYVAALELCARLPEEMRLPEEAADLVPVALEAELEQNVQQFAGEQFDNPSPHVETLDFVDVDDEIWLRLRLGIPPESFGNLNPDEIEDHALQKLEGML